MELQNTDKHSGITTSLAQDVWQLLRSMLTAQWSAPHHCERRECSHCEARVMWHQLALELVTIINPEMTAHPPDVSSHRLPLLVLYDHLHYTSMSNCEFLNRTKRCLSVELLNCFLCPRMLVSRCWTILGATTPRLHVAIFGVDFPVHSLWSGVNKTDRTSCGVSTCLLTSSCPWHHVNSKRDQRPCEWFQTFVEETSEEGQSRKSPPESEKKQDAKAEVVLSMPMPLLEVHTVGGVLVHMPHVSSFHYQS